MGIKKHKYSPEERARLVTLFMDSGMTVTAFSEKHGIARYTLYRWIKTYEEHGINGLLGEPYAKIPKIAPELQSDAELRKEILRLRIENERLKKNYTVRTTPDGKTEYVRLKPKSMK
jgi:transposase-like protein